jgi:hypothetical protein
MNRYFYIDTAGKQKGAFTPEELQRENVRRETLVWTQDMSQWTRAEEVDELKYIFTGAPPPPFTEPEVILPPPIPKTWLTESILATILPFLLCGSLFNLLGIIGIIYASQVETLYRRGEYDAAMASSRTAGRWTRAVLWIAFLWIILTVLAFVGLLLFLGGSLTALITYLSNL